MQETYYSSINFDFFKYNFNFRERGNEIIIEKFEFLTTEMIEEYVLKTPFFVSTDSKLIVFDNLMVDSVNRIFSDERVFPDVKKFIPILLSAIRLEMIDPTEEVIQDLIATYPESFI